MGTRVETRFQGYRDDTACHAIIPSLQFTLLVSVFPLYMGMEVADQEVWNLTNMGPHPPAVFQVVQEVDRENP